MPRLNQPDRLLWQLTGSLLMVLIFVHFLLNHRQERSNGNWPWSSNNEAVGVENDLRTAGQTNPEWFDLQSASHHSKQVWVILHSSLSLMDHSWETYLRSAMQYAVDGNAEFSLYFGNASLLVTSDRDVSLSSALSRINSTELLDLSAFVEGIPQEVLVFVIGDAPPPTTRAYNYMFHTFNDTYSSHPWNQMKSVIKDTCTVESFRLNPSDVLIRPGRGEENFLVSSEVCISSPANQGDLKLSIEDQHGQRLSPVDKFRANGTSCITLPLTMPGDLTKWPRNFIVRVIGRGTMRNSWAFSSGYFAKMFEKVAQCKKLGGCEVALLGPPGAGKTTIPAVIYWSLYGQWLYPRIADNGPTDTREFTSYPIGNSLTILDMFGLLKEDYPGDSIYKVFNGTADAGTLRRNISGETVVEWKSRAPKPAVVIVFLVKASDPGASVEGFPGEVLKEAVAYHKENLAKQQYFAITFTHGNGNTSDVKLEWLRQTLGIQVGQGHYLYFPDTGDKLPGPEDVTLDISLQYLNWLKTLLESIPPQNAKSPTAAPIPTGVPISSPAPKGRPLAVDG